MNRYKPMLARTAHAPFISPDWIFEVKWDGIRAIAYVGAKLSIRSRNDKELKGNFSELEELRDLARDVVLDGEIVAMNGGRPDFQALLERSQTSSSADVEYFAQRHPSTYVVFDILERDGAPLVDLPLIERKRLLKESFKEGKHVTLSLYVEGNGEEYYAAAIKRGLEGVMAKMKASRYEPGARSGSWLKIKRDLSCDCVIFGYTRGEGRRKAAFGALVLGLYDDGKPVYVGKVGTGFSDEDLNELMGLLEGLKVEGKALQGADIPQGVTWLSPVLVCEVGYQAVTKDLKLRMPRFRGLRSDKSPLECTIDQIRPASLEEYSAKRDFGKTPEPRSEGAAADGRSFVVHEHHARRLHYDLRLERGGVLKSWAVPKDPPGEGEKRLAVETEDHPLEYGRFEGTIPEGQYGAGTVKIWDRGVYEPIVWERDKIELIMIGERLKGRYVLVRLKKAKEGEWLFFRAKD